MEKVTLAHGSGGQATAELIDKVFKHHLNNEYFTADDASVLPNPQATLAMSTDGFIVSPCAFVIEEGFDMDQLEEIVASMEKCAKEVGVKIVAGDTKVAGKGQVDQVFITTTGVGAIKDGIKTSGAYAKAGDAIIVTGDIGRHGTCILLERDDYGIEANVSSDCAPLWNAVDALTDKVKDVHVIRDATRGGVGTVLYEIAREANVGIKLENKKIPVAEEVRGVTGMLGLDPLYLACEGRMVIVVPACEADQTLQILHQSKHTENAALIGYVTDEHPRHVTITTEIGSETLLPPPGNELLPRIC